MRAGKLRHRLIIQTKTSTGDGMGGYTESWTDAHEVLGAVWPLQGDQKLQAMQMGGVVTHTIKMRYVEDVNVHTRIQVGDTTQRFDVTSVVNRDYLNRELTVYANEDV